MDGVPVHFEHIQGIKLLYLTEIGRGIHRSCRVPATLSHVFNLCLPSCVIIYIITKELLSNIIAC
jgi:hypothetical protein